MTDAHLNRICSFFFIVNTAMWNILDTVANIHRMYCLFIDFQPYFHLNYSETTILPWKNGKYVEVADGSTFYDLRGECLFTRDFTKIILQTFFP